ncbi:MAG: 23S rRNA (pseudouridine(1915)-N(3))-methyltransferase RlmH [Candidatus Magasanikbacteria bacterium CG10_big_fil_rev_8_21_14_0_10_36_32]|uniref:Ribosomal RNA large subunit methyltransferase H n=1 Tax=Candidatus Magasanikbacteria bacterium CG10_big_fil_rev_8_21_14_0_10_36_32 TaxID=1974646 RepID=A0A2M6W6R4_9BACT|nr:MAG: 23S rRNA (pseudouridine(1915)-N(3))-methyltransferase RlmH [Candidatus Magasanikbacteria bacterium CG10_big_fil_rev_8_21_14_0_10_36_32]
MIHINLICLGKLKEKFWREAENEYLKRLSAFSKIKIHELKEESFNEKNSPKIIKQKEAEKILSILKKQDGLIIALDEHGQQFSSIAFAEKIKPAGKITFIIGGPLGLDESVLKIANLKLSLSSMTFTHQMVRVILWEQTYRAMMINSNRKYHY